MQFKIMHITGARPHFMKLAPVWHEAERRDEIRQVIVHTGQHYDDRMFRNFLDEFDLPAPAYDLNAGSGRHASQIGKMLIALDEVLLEEEPDIIFVYGDTNSTAAGAIAGAKSNIPVAHVEAGLREFNKQIPEEVNKLLIDAVADLYFCPTKSAVCNLQDQGIDQNVFHVGDVVVDLIKKRGTFNKKEISANGHILLTCHRAVNTDDPQRLRSILEAAKEMDKNIIFPVHPRTAGVMALSGLNALVEDSKIELIEPCSFWEMQSLIKGAVAVMTDSGGVIREAYVHRKPCVIVDDQTEWQESVDEGWAVVAGADKSAIVGAFERIRDFDGPQSNFLGNGDAAVQIIDHTLDYLVENAEHADR